MCVSDAATQSGPLSNILPKLRSEMPAIILKLIGATKNSDLIGILAKVKNEETSDVEDVLKIIKS